MAMTPTKVVLENTGGNLVVRVFAPELNKGFTVIESTPLKTGKSISGLVKFCAKYAKRFGIPFENKLEGK